MSAGYICPEQTFQLLEDLSAQLHVIEALATANVTHARVHFCPRKISLFLAHLDRELSKAIDDIQHQTQGHNHA